MRKWLLAPCCFLALNPTLSQDSTAAIYIDQLVARIEQQLQQYILEKTDTVIYEEGDSLKQKPSLVVRTEYYTNPRNWQLEKVAETSRYNNLNTVITVYYHNNQPVRLSSVQREGATLKLDFDVYFMNSNFVHCVRRTGVKGEPDSAEFYRWCLELFSAYKRMLAASRSQE